MFIGIISVDINIFGLLQFHEAEKEWLSVKIPYTFASGKKQYYVQSMWFPLGFKVEKYQIFQGVPQMILHDEDCIDLGNRSW